LLKELKDALVVRPDPLKGPELETIRKAIFAADAESREDAAHAWQSLKKLGNETMKAGLIWPAEAAYRAALEEGANVVPTTEASLIDSNRALALLKGGHHAEAAAAAQRALERDPRNAKAAYRRAQALLEDPQAGHRELAEAHEAAMLAARLEPKDAKAAEMCSKVQSRQKELPPDVVVESSDACAEDLVEEALDSMD